VITTLFSTKQAIDTGDWSRFGKDIGINTISTSISSLVGYGASLGLAAAGIATAWITVPCVIVLSGLSYWGSSKLITWATPLGDFTEKEMRLAYDNYKKTF